MINRNSTPTKDTILHVMATEKASVIPVGSGNSGQVKFIGKQTIPGGPDGKTTFEIIPEGEMVPYHPEIINHLKKGDLLALHIETALKAGVMVYIPELEQSF
jgi:hypothetical protein